MKKYSFCENVQATPLGLWHIRELSKEGRKLSGGADTKALCGREVAWDIDVHFSFHHLNNSCCKKCKEIFEALV